MLVGAIGGFGPEHDREGQPADRLDTVIDALHRLASALPAGLELFTAVFDRRSEASDVFVRDEAGATSVRLGLADAEREQLTAVVASLRDSAIAGPRSSLDEEQPDPSARHLDDGRLRALDYRAIVEECPIPLVVISTDGMIEYASPALVPLLGIDEPAALEGRFMAQLLHPDDRDRVARVAQLALSKLDTTTLSARLRRWDGSMVRTEIAVRVLPGRDRLILALQPAGAGRSGIEEVLGSERRQRALAGAADAGTALVNTTGDSAGAVIDLNPQFGYLVGGAPGQLVGVPVWELVEHPDSTRVHQALREVVDGGGARRLEVRLAGEPGRRASVVISLDRSSGDPPTQATVLLRDITEQHVPFGELSRTIERLEQQNHELAEFARVTAHDLVAPLRALSGLVDVLAPTLEEHSEDALVAVQNAIGRMLAMVDSAMGFADAQAREPNHVPVDLNEVVDHALATLGPDIVATDAEISVVGLPNVSGDDAQLERLFLSLVTNALSYGGDDPPRIQIGAEPDGTMWRVTVADQGIGVDPEAREEIFRLFERRAPAPDRTANPRGAAVGYGIGLATARQIVEQHGGRIWVEPNHPRGSVFVVALPGA